MVQRICHSLVHHNEVNRPPSVTQAADFGGFDRGRALWVALRVLATARLAWLATVASDTCADGGGGGWAGPPPRPPVLVVYLGV